MAFTVRCPANPMLILSTAEAGSFHRAATLLRLRHVVDDGALPELVCAGLGLCLLTSARLGVGLAHVLLREVFDAVEMAHLDYLAGWYPTNGNPALEPFCGNSPYTAPACLSFKAEPRGALVWHDHLGRDGAASNDPNTETSNMGDQGEPIQNPGSISARVPVEWSWENAFPALACNSLMT